MDLEEEKRRAAAEAARRGEEGDGPAPPGFGFGGITPGGRGRKGVTSSGVLAKFTAGGGGDGGGGTQVYVAYATSAQFRPTFVQINDISQYGDPEEVGSIVLPRASGDGSGGNGVKNLSVASRKVSLPPRDTGTVAGLYTPPPKTYYTYQFDIEEQAVQLVLAASKGKVYWLAVTNTKDGTSSGSGAGGISADQIAESFRVK